MNRMRSSSGLLTLIAISFVTPTFAADANWPAWRGVNRDAMSPDVGLLDAWPEGGPELLWQVDGLGSGFSNVAVTGGKIFTSGDVEDQLHVFVFDLEGKLLWKKPVDDAWTRNHPGSRSTPTIDGGNLYLLSGHGKIVCLDAETGDENWTRSTRDFGGRPGGWGYAESVLIHENLAIVKPGGETCIVALDKLTGAAVWESSGFTAKPEYSSCLFVEFEGHPLIVTGTRSGIVCVDAGNGRLQWSNDWCTNNTANCPTPAYSDGYVFWSNGYGKGGICMKMKKEGESVTADVAWTTNDLVCHHGGYIIKDGYIYGNHSGGWACLDLETGEHKWFERAVGKGSLCYADNKLFLFGERGGRAGVASFAPEGMELTGEVEVEGTGPSWAHPVVIGGRLYLRYADNLYCFNVKDE